MKNRLKRLLNEEFEYEVPKMLLSGHDVTLKAECGQTVRGAFVVTCPGDGKMRGFLHSTSPRIVLADQTFFGHENIVRFTADTRGMTPGETASGMIRISSSLGEEGVSVTVTTEPEEKKESRPSYDLAAEAEKDFRHAAGLFAAQTGEDAAEGGFRAKDGTAAKKSLPDLALQEGLSGEKNPLRQLEEYLIGTGQKESVDVAPDWTFRKIRDPEGTMRETITLTASGWGYLEISLSSDARFLRPEKTKITTMDFAGNRYELGLIIDTNFLHAGRNYGRIMIRTCYRTTFLTVRVDVSGNEEARRQSRVRKLMRKKALLLYLDYRMGKTDLHNWAERTLSVLGAYSRAGGENVYAALISVFVLQADGKRREAERQLALLEKQPERFTDPDSYVFLLFLTTFFTRDTGYIGQVRTTVREIQGAHPDNWKISWVCLYLLEEGRSQADRLLTVTRQIDAGCSSPFMLLEGILILRKDPYLLHEITPAMRLIFSFACRAGLLTQQLCLELCSLEKRKPSYDPVIFRVLRKCIGLGADRDVLEALSAMAIAGKKKESRYFPLYRTAVLKDASVVGLYEYYMEAMDECRIETMPETIRRYFVYNDTLDYHKKARIFRNISDSRSRLPGIFSSMKPAIVRFVTDQLAQGHLDHDLAVLYSDFLEKPMLTDKLAAALLNLLFTYRVDCLSPDMKKIIVCDSRFSKELTADIKDGKAMVRIWSDQTRILLEDGEGRRYASTSLYMADRCLEDTALFDMCLSLIPDDPGFALLYTLNTAGKEPVTKAGLGYFLKAAGMELLSEDFRRQIKGWLTDYFDRNPQDPALDHFLGKISPEDLAPDRLPKLIGLYVSEGRSEEAYKLILRYGHDRVPVSLLVRICSQMVLAREYDEDERLLACCFWCFDQGKYDKNILAYLALYADGTISGMEKIERAAKLYGIDTMRLDGKILSLIVLGQNQTEGSGEIYASYRAALGSRVLIRAYRILVSYLYFVKGKELPGQVVPDLEKEREKGGSALDICSLALLKYLSGKERTAEEDRIAGDMLQDLEDMGVRFAFFRDYPEEMHSAAGIRERVFLEYAADPSSSVTVSFRLKGSSGPYTEETMKDVYAGVRVKEFVLFGREEVEYLTEECRLDGTRILSGIRTLKAPEVPAGSRETFYGRLSALSETIGRGDEKQAREQLLDLRQTEAVVNELFTLS